MRISIIKNGIPVICKEDVVEYKISSWGGDIFLSMETNIRIWLKNYDSIEIEKGDRTISYPISLLNEAVRDK